jgi:putative transcriptional regulator
MSKIGKRLIKSAKQARAYARGEARKGFVLHVPTRPLNRAVRVGRRQLRQLDP